MLSRILSPHSERAYALLRIVSGTLFFLIGCQKVFGLLASNPQPPVGSQMWVGGIIEIATGAAIAAGFFGSCAAFVASGTMAVAYAQFHWKFRMDRNFFPTVNGGFPAVLCCFLFLYMACKGSGIWSVDQRRKKDSKP